MNGPTVQSPASYYLGGNISRSFSCVMSTDARQYYHQSSRLFQREVHCDSKLQSGGTQDHRLPDRPVTNSESACTLFQYEGGPHQGTGPK